MKPFIVIAAMTSVMYVDTFIPYGWSSAAINGSVLTKANGDFLPSTWSCAVVDTNSTRVTASASAARKRNQTGTVANQQNGTVSFGYKIRTTRLFVAESIEMRAVITADVAANGLLGWSGSSANGTANGALGGLSSGQISVSSANPEESKSAGPTSRETRVKVSPTLAWNTESVGSKSLLITVSSLGLNMVAKATCPGGGSNSVAVSTSASGSYKFTPISIRPLSNSVACLSGTANVYGSSIWGHGSPMSLDIYNANNVPLESFECTVDDGAFVTSFEDHPAGTYHIYASAPGSLRKRIDVNWTGSSGLSGLNFDLKYGDINGDGFISQAEVDYIQSMIGVTTGSISEFLGSFDYAHQTYMGNPDLNQDGVVTIADYNLALPNVGLYGD